MSILPDACPQREIVVEQVGPTWHIVQRDRPILHAKTLDEAIVISVQAFRDRRVERCRIVVLPPDSPYMWD